MLVTGGGGQLAKSIADIAGEFPDVQLHLKTSVELDITDVYALHQVFLDREYDYCVNCAAFTAVDEAEKSPAKAFAVNAEAVKSIAGLCYSTATTLVHISTDYVFDGRKQSGYFPDDPPNPINEYGRSKLQGEQYVQEILSRFFIIRTSWLYDEKAANFYTTILEKAKRGEALRVTDAQKGCPTHVATVARYILGLIENGRTDYGIHHVTDGVPMTWYDFADEILQTHGLRDTVSLVRDKNYRSFAPRPENSVLLQ